MAKRKSNPKNGFWLLTMLFGVLSVACLGLVWNGQGDTSRAEEAMGNQMGNSMGLMMREQHGGFLLRDLFKTGEISTMMSMQGHHQTDNLNGKIHYASTAAIFLLFPWIVGGLVCLFVLWQ